VTGDLFLPFPHYLTRTSTKHDLPALFTKLDTISTLKLSDSHIAFAIFAIAIASRQVYAGVEFSSQPGKYNKYNVQVLEGMLNKFFDEFS
jgi:hypothetical protein